MSCSITPSLLLGPTIVVAALAGCKPELPVLEDRGERVRVGSAIVDPVCKGTLNRLDREVEQIEARLDIPRQDTWLDVYLVDRAMVDAYCDPGSSNCTVIPHRGAPFVVVDSRRFERAITHELVHARLASSFSAPLFNEGMADALAVPSCPRAVPDVDLSTALAAQKSVDLLAVKGTYYAASELIAWLLDEFGPEQVLSLFRAVDKHASPSTIEAKYFEYFGRELESDFLTHLRTRADLDALPPEDFGCLLEPLDLSGGPSRLTADLDCDSERVHNDFGAEGGGYVEWTLHLDQAQTLELVGELPVGTRLTIEACGCMPQTGDDEPLRSFAGSETLEPGTYRLRWLGALDEGLSLDVELVAGVYARAQTAASRR